ncbi:hypothetical protein Rrhod_3026 [Rhodococcus rhodnii LMG 5362]|uniref:Uncharacterized protein n=1 Tax=Rhodococcus rhodnii LMG 5362 TaxID=1273125 RepID=R7WJS1_9NOCA|nr:hypothetical protein Rrhod_3026 [Rhodococcus rhodnii LMG 5362]
MLPDESGGIRRATTTRRGRLDPLQMPGLDGVSHGGFA